MMATGHSSINMIRIVLADDHDILRQGLALLLGIQDDMQIVGEARTGPEAIAATEALLPDVVVMDITMPDMDGLEACSYIRKKLPNVQVLMLTMHESEEYFLKALRMGAAGYIVKKAAPHELQAAVRVVAQGGVFLYPGLAKALVRAYITQPANAASTPQQESSISQELHTLTSREMEILTLVAEGWTNQDIADHLGISIKTVQAHRANVMDKLGLHNVTQLVRFALRHGLIP
ncbi:MAG TPA: response regulator transcription factor [Ktedonobacteraceae bacterium]|nr:response regulator transcription factor [Ktedonobacteraceae bacterium]